MEEKKVKKIEITMNDDNTTSLKLMGSFDEVGLMFIMGIDTLCEEHGVNAEDFTRYMAEQLGEVARKKKAGVRFGRN